MFAMRKYKLLTIAIDEQLPPEIEKPFRYFGFRVIKINKTNKYKGKDERDYLGELYANNCAFITSDEIFVKEVLDEKLKNAGMIFIPKQMERNEKEIFAWVASGFIMRIYEIDGKNGLRNKVAYPAHEGFHVIENGNDKLDASWSWLSDKSDVDSIWDP